MDFCIPISKRIIIFATKNWNYYGKRPNHITNLSANEEELKHNGYFLCRGNSLKKFKLQFDSDIDVAHKAVARPTVGWGILSGGRAAVLGAAAQRP